MRKQVHGKFPFPVIIYRADAYNKVTPNTKGEALIGPATCKCKK